MSRRRRSPKSSTSLTALVGTEKAIARPYAESSLERDMLRLLRAREDVVFLLTQPFEIPWWDEDGTPHTYTPDIQVQYKPDFWLEPAAAGLCPLRRTNHVEVFEIKYRGQLRRNIIEFRPKFHAARAYCAERGWRFSVVTERTIRSLALDHARFFFALRDRELNLADAQLIQSALKDKGEVVVDSLLRDLTNDEWRQTELLAVVWIMVLRGTLEVDPSIPPSAESRVWLVVDGGVSA